MLAVCLVAFAGFLHCNELIKLKCSDITFNAEGTVINVQSSKTDQYRECASLVIAHTGSVTCPACEHNGKIFSYWEVRSYIPWNAVSCKSTDKGRREFA